MIVFWIAAALLSALAAALVLQRAALLARSSTADPAVEVYQRQLGEIDDLAERGLLAESERRSARAEAGRRLLGAVGEAEAQAASSAAPSRSVRLWVVIGAAAGPLLALGLYLLLGAPGLPDQPFAARLQQWRGVADPSQLTAPQLAAVLQDVVKHRPKDLEGRLLLARAQAASGDLPGAVQTLKSASRLAPGDVDIWAALGEALVEQAQGRETPAAIDAFQRAAALDPQAAGPRYHLGRAKIMNGDLNGGLADWRALLALLPGADQKQALQQRIDASQKAGRLVEAPPEAQQAQTQPPAAGPTPDQLQAAEQAQAGASAASQRAFIQSMVDAMAARLKANPRDPQGWALLIHSYGVLGENDKQAQARAQARALFKGDATALKAIDGAAP